MSVVITLLQALIAIPKIGQWVEKLIIAIASWHTGREKEKTKKLVQKAHRAQKQKDVSTKEGRIDVAKKWQAVFTRPRY